MSVTIRIPSVLRPLTGGAARLSAAGDNTLVAVLSELGTAHPGLTERLLEADGSLRSFVNVFVNGEDVRFLDGTATPLRSGDEVSIVPAAAGG